MTLRVFGEVLSTVWMGLSGLRMVLNGFGIVLNGFGMVLSTPRTHLDEPLACVRALRTRLRAACYFAYRFVNPFRAFVTANDPSSLAEILIQ
jgi:hypothetical protein